MSGIRRFVKTTIIYFLGNVLTRMISFLMLPVYTKYIVPSDFGYYDLTIAYITFFSSVLFLDIWSGIMRFMFDYKETDYKRHVILNGVFIFLGSMALYTLLTITLGVVFNINYIMWIYLYGALLCTQTLFAYIARGYGKNLRFAISGLIGTLVMVSCNILFLVFLKADYSALYISACIGYIIQIVILNSQVKIFKRDFLKNFDKALTKKLLLYSLPLAINSAAYWFLTSYSRVIISTKLGIHENGLYAVAGKFPAALSIVTVCFTLAWQEMAYEKGDADSNSGEFYSKASNLYLKFLGMGTLALIPLIYILFPFMVDVKYSEAADIIPMYMLATVTSIYSSFLSSIFGALKLTNIIFTSTLAGSLINVLLLHLLINPFGLPVVNIALFVGFLINDIIRLFVLNKQIELKIDFNFLILFAVGMLLTSYIYINFGIMQNLIVMLIIFIIVLFMFREFLTRTIKYIMGQISKKGV